MRNSGSASNSRLTIDLPCRRNESACSPSERRMISLATTTRNLRINLASVERELVQLGCEQGTCPHVPRSAATIGGCFISSLGERGFGHPSPSPSPEERGAAFGILF